MFIKHHFFLGVAYDGACTGAGMGDCAEANNICDAVTSKCACDTGFFRKTTAECAARKRCLVIYVVV